MFGTILFGLSVVAIPLIYFLPSLIASKRRHRSGGSVFVLNLFLGWTLIGWVVALAISLSSDVATAKA